ncbi:TPA: transposase [Escherichia coli]|nr:transposase [Escherichia coli]HCQ3786625.1 transposase [Escherichia coli]
MSDTSDYDQTALAVCLQISGCMRGICIDFSRPGTPTDNAPMDLFNSRLRQECLNENWFMSLDDARCKIEARRIHFIQRYPLSALDRMTPSKFSKRTAGCQDMKPRLQIYRLHGRHP